MNTIRSVLLKQFFTKTINWKLFVFLLLFLNVKLVVKLAALLLIYVLQPNFRFGYRLKNTRLPFFYPLVIMIALINAVLYQHFFHTNYLAVLLFGIGLWIGCILAIHQIKLMVEKTDSAVICQTLVLFFLVNAFVSAAEFIRIMAETGTINPFRYQGEYQKYFISTGDYIKGISFDTSTTNAILNAFGIVFFLWKRSWIMALTCTCVLLMTASNMVNLILFAILLLLFIFRTTKDQKSIIVVCFSLLAIFMAKVSPQNNQYAGEVFEKFFPEQKRPTEGQARKMDVREVPDINLTADQRKEKKALLYLDSLNRRTLADKQDQPLLLAALTGSTIKAKPSLPQPSIHSALFQNRNDTNAVRKELLEFISAKVELKGKEILYEGIDLPGKAIAWKQTTAYLLQNPGALVTGLGLGNFSSKMAFKATSLKFAGGFPRQLTYINPEFANNHLSLYLHFFSEHSKKHSITNSPNSVYDQLLTEYGFVGLISFSIFYIGFFARQYKKLSYGVPLLFLLLCFFFIDYWFEQLSVVILFELMLFLNIKENSEAA